MTSEAKKQMGPIDMVLVWATCIVVSIFLVGLAARSLFPVEVKKVSTVYVSRPDPQLVSCATLPVVIWQGDELRLVAIEDKSMFPTDPRGYHMEQLSAYNALGDRCWVNARFDTPALLALAPFDRHFDNPSWALTLASLPQARAVILAISNCEATRVRP